MADHLSRLEMEERDPLMRIQEVFPNEHLFQVKVNLTWYADVVNYLACRVLPPDLSSYQRKKFLHDVKSYMWDDLLLFKWCSNKIVRRCVPMEEVPSILNHCIASPYGGHFGPTRTKTKVLE